MALTHYVLPAIGAVLVWWLSTGIILVLTRLPRRTHGWCMVGATGVASLALIALLATKSDVSVPAIYVSFLAGIALWGWHEMSFLMGFVTGSRKTDCPADCNGWRRLVYATQTLLHHELAIAATALVMLALTWGSANQVGVWAFMILWGMRISAKFNVFLGVPNLTEEFLPVHLNFLRSYFRNRPMNGLFPLSVTVGTVVTAVLVAQAFDAQAATPERVGAMILAMLMGLAVLEHWFLVLPLHDAALWAWARRMDEDTSGGDVAGKAKDTGSAVRASTAPREGVQRIATPILTCISSSNVSSNSTALGRGTNRMADGCPAVPETASH